MSTVLNCISAPSQNRTGAVNASGSQPSLVTGIMPQQLAQRNQVLQLGKYRKSREGEKQGLLKCELAVTCDRLAAKSHEWKSNVTNWSRGPRDRARPRRSSLQESPRSKDIGTGEACQDVLVGLADDKLCEIAQRELADLLGIRAEPHVRELARWNRAMPQYHLGHLDRVAKIEQIVSNLPAFALAGNASTFTIPATAS